MNEKEVRKRKERCQMIADRIARNFGGQDLVLWLDWDQPVTDPYAAKQYVRTFLNRVKRWRRKEGLPDMKYYALYFGEPRQPYRCQLFMTGAEGHEEAINLAGSFWPHGAVRTRFAGANEFPADEFAGVDAWTANFSG